MTSHSDDTLWTRLFWRGLAAVFAFRLAFMLFFCQQADLLGDEAYYWDWGRQPDWGYFSKPPMIGWLMGLAGWLTGNAEWGIRLAPLLLSTGTLAAVFSLARDLYGARAACLAALLIVLTPGNAGLNLFFTIDAPLLLAWSLAMLALWRAAEEAKPAWWLVLALALGFGVLSKQMMLVFPALALVFSAVSKDSRPMLARPGFWLAALAGMAFITPVLMWNARHEWVTLEHTRHHFDTESLGMGKWLGRTLEFPAVQALVYTPVTFATLIFAAWLSLKNWRALGSRERYLLVFSVLPLLGFLLLSLRQRINPNWPAVFYVPLFILAAAWLEGRLPFPPRSAWKKWSLRVAGSVTALLHLALLVIFLTDLKGHKKLVEMQGWHETGSQAGAFLDDIPNPRRAFVLVAGYRYDAAQLAFHMPQQPRVYRWSKTADVESQYEVWPGPEERLGDDALIFQPGKEAPAELKAPLRACFENAERLGRIETPLGGGHVRYFDVFLARNLLTWTRAGGMTSAP
ncbi:MAG TPA: hypothetical protein DIT64_11610 [Verrucomicrobiales bacterium]|nr:hypothetical protein [Verrucomicrobiales bacterium]